MVRYSEYFMNIFWKAQKISRYLQVEPEIGQQNVVTKCDRGDV